MDFARIGKIVWAVGVTVLDGGRLLWMGDMGRGSGGIKCRNEEGQSLGEKDAVLRRSSSE